MTESAVRRLPSAVGSSEARTITDPAIWDGLVAGLPRAHLLQSWEWGEFKVRNGWRPARLMWETPDGEAAAQVLARTAWRLARVLYVPRGPLVAWDDEAAGGQVLDALQALARRQRAILIKIDPDVAVATGGPGQDQPCDVGQALQAELRRRGWVPSAGQVQFRNTITLDLRRDEADLLAAMKPKTRYNLRLAERKGVAVRAGTVADLDLLYRLYAETSLRDAFVIRGRDYYQAAWGRFMAAGLAQPFVADVGGEAVGGLVVYRFARTAYYMFGMSRAAHREKMPNHLLQWAAIRWAREQGCETYDFWGAPDELVETDRLWGVWKFKEGFGGQLVRGLGAWDYAPSPALYRLYTGLLPRLLAVMRRRGRQATREALEAA
jgi:lipid II:glycine glycyltransferase (peptidoglycan interpeptide bridge formation enzyme)